MGAQMNAETILVFVVVYVACASIMAGNILSEFVSVQKNKGKSLLYINTALLLGIALWPAVFIHRSYKNYHNKMKDKS